MTPKELFEQVKRDNTPEVLLETYDDAVFDWGIAMSHHNEGDLYCDDLYDFGRENYSEEAWDDLFSQLGMEEIGIKYNWSLEDYIEFQYLVKEYMNE